MPRITKVKEILDDMDADDIIKVVKGKLIQLYKEKTGTGNFGPYCFQNGMIEDDTGKIKVKFANREPIPMSHRNKWISLESTQGNKGWNGVKVKDDSFENNDGDRVEERILWVTKTAEVHIEKDMGGKESSDGEDDPGMDGQDGNYPDDRSSIPNKGKKKQEQRSTPSRSTNRGSDDGGSRSSQEQEHPVTRTRKFVARNLNLMRITLRAVESLSREYEEAYGRPMPDGLIQSCNATLFIEAARALQAHGLPLGPLPLKKQEPAPNDRGESSRSEGKQDPPAEERGSKEREPERKQESGSDTGEASEEELAARYGVDDLF